MGDAIELMNLYWTTSGLRLGEGTISRFPFRSRVESAAKAGFVGIGLWHTDLEHIQAGMTLREMKRIMDDNGIVYLELEFLTDWFAEGGRKAESDAIKRRLLEASAALGAKHIKIGDFYGEGCPMQRAVDAFGELCGEARDYGATIGFEFMKGNFLGTLPQALELVTKAGAANGGIIIDIVQQVNLGIALNEIRRIPAGLIVCAELNDGILPHRPGHDMAVRRFCGEGEYDVKGFIDAVSSAGYRGPWAVEVFNPEYPALGLDELNARAYRTTMAEFRS
jgi:sugar phosphate isomerase/epimerase